MEKKYIVEQFDDFNSKFSPSISIDNMGGFNFGGGFLNKYGLQEANRVNLFYLKDEAGISAIGFKIYVADLDSTGMELRAKGDAKYFKSNSFWSKYSLNPKNFSGKYEPTEYSDELAGKIFEIKLKDKTKSS
jgi:hypothetical protein